MTEAEYQKKRADYASSSAPKEIIEKAIKELDEKYLASQDMQKAILKDIEAGSADIDDLS